MRNAATSIGGSQARGLALVVGVATALSLLGAAGAGEDSAPLEALCDAQVTVQGLRGTRLVCSTDPGLRGCPPVGPGDAVADDGGECRQIPEGMSARHRLLVELPLDLNRATAAELELLDGIGPTLAARIVSHRQQEGPFLGVRDLERVAGIGPKTVARLRSRLFVGPSSVSPADHAQR